ncbi:MAG TPA: hypothetical protein DC006_01450 [Prevotellaceae bacterium]|nr:hypothetical protein [Prevotellaceae bacterium]HBE55811.1 hypothetical protein [Prevotellaceae bacterium]
MLWKTLVFCNGGVMGEPRKHSGSFRALKHYCLFFVLQIIEIPFSRVCLAILMAGQEAACREWFGMPGKCFAGFSGL